MNQSDFKMIVKLNKLSQIDRARRKFHTKIERTEPENHISNEKAILKSFFDFFLGFILAGILGFMLAGKRSSES